MRRTTLAVAAAAALLCAAPAMAQSLADFEKRTTVHRLSNGWTFIICERPVAPVFSFATYADVGSAQEVLGITGLAHMFEHMAFKGTDKIGTTDYAAEKTALGKVEAAYLEYDAERRKLDADPAKIKQLEEAWKKAQDEADAFVKKNELDEILEGAGGVGINAGTSNDQTIYFYSMPSNKLELWAYLESERFLHPVFREFYKERDVVQEERRMRTESSPFGRIMEQFLATAFVAHPYGTPVVGWMSDLKSFSATDAEAFYKKYYVPSNLYTAVVGDVKATEVVPLLEKYFGRIPKGDKPPVLRTIEPPQNGERVVKIVDPAQPIYAEGYHRPATSSPDEEAYGALATILGGGRTSRLYRSLVRDKQIASNANVFESFPGDKYPNLMVVFAIPARGHTNEEVQKAIREELKKVASEEVGDAELAMVKARAKANLVRSLGNNEGLAENLVQNQVLEGDWRDLFRGVERLEKVTKADVLRVAKETFKETNRTVGYIETASAKPAPAGE